MFTINSHCTSNAPALENQLAMRVTLTDCSARHIYLLIYTQVTLHRTDIHDTTQRPCYEGNDAFHASFIYSYVCEDICSIIVMILEATARSVLYFCNQIVRPEPVVI